MTDPGDGSRLEEPNLTIARMAVRWARIAEAHGNLGDEARAYLEQYG